MESSHQLLTRVVVVEFTELQVLYLWRPYNGVKVLIQTIVAHDLVSHGCSQGLQRVRVGVMVCSDHFIEVVHHVFLRSHLTIITLQSHSQTYNTMQDDQFHDYESAPPSQNPSELPQASHAPLETASQHSFLLDTAQALSLTPSYSQITNAPSQQTNAQERRDDYGTAWPPLAKMESQSVVPLDPYNLDFTKTHSHHELPTQFLDPSQEFLSLDKQNLRIQDPTTNHSEHSQFPPSFKQNTSNLNQKEESDFLFESSQPHQSNQMKNQASNLNDYIPDPMTLGHYMIQQEKAEPQQIQQHFKLAQFEEEDFNFEPKIESAIESQPKNTDSVDPRKESEEFEFQQIVQQTKEPVDNQFQEVTEPRKQSDDFVFQEAAEKSSHETSPQEYLSPSIDPPPIILDEAHTEEQPFSQHESHPEIEIKQQSPYKEVAKDEDEDQFGDFEETVEPVENSPEKHEIREQGETEVKIDGSRAPYGMEIPSREQELKAFVASLPDYRFILAEAFKTV